MFKDKLKELREKEGLSQQELAKNYSFQEVQLQNGKMVMEYLVMLI